MAEHFAADWLALREPLDHRARADALVDTFVSWWQDGRADAERGTCQVVDLGSGTGSNLRYLAPRLPGPQTWTLVDHDAELLGRVTHPASPDVTVHPVVRDFTADASMALSVPGQADAPTRLVTASALFDLVSERWLRQLVGAIAAEDAAALFALSYDGQIDWRDPDPDDGVVLSAVNAHQRGEKDFGTALGPTAGGAIQAAFQRAGYLTFAAESPWQLGGADMAIARRLVDGWCAAATEQSPGDREVISAWTGRRQSAIDAGAFALTVGHIDVLALPPG